MLVVFSGVVIVFSGVLVAFSGVLVAVSGALVVTQGRYEETWDVRLTEEDRTWIFGDLLKEYSDVLRFDWNTNLTGAYECPAGREKVSVSLLEPLWVWEAYNQDQLIFVQVWSF